MTSIILSHTSVKNICDAANCYRVATTEISVGVGELGNINLNLCENCPPRFKEDKKKVWGEV